MSKSNIFVILTVAAITAILVLGGVFAGSRIAGGSDTVKALSAKNPEEMPAVGGSDDKIAIPGFEKLVMKAGQAKQEVNFYNPESNDCYFSICIALEDGTELFRSGMIKPGQKIDAIEISRILEAGTYKSSVLQYDCFALETLQPLNGSKTVLNLEVIP